MAPVCTERGGGAGNCGRIDTTLTGANSFHEKEAVGKSDPVEGRDLLHVVTDRPRRSVEAAIKGQMGAREAS